MAFPSSKSRKIVVDAAEYAWVVSPDSGYMTILVKRAGFDGGLMRVQCGYDREVSPGRVAEWIRIALQQGWNPERGTGEFTARMPADS